MPRGSSAITIGPVVSMRRRSVGSERLLRHEVEHVRQWKRLGVLGNGIRERDGEELRGIQGGGWSGRTTGTGRLVRASRIVRRVAGRPD